MRKIIKIKEVLILSFIAGFSIFALLNYSLSQYEFALDLKNEGQLKRAGFWEIGPIEIDDQDPLKNWSITAATYNWCRGSGTWEDPYIIENVTIDGQNNHNCIRIDNSDVYFTIRNCTLINGVGEYWHSGGIRLENVTKGSLINNDCSFNQQGIILRFSSNNTISRNTANKNTIHGITLYDQCNDTKIIGNTACFNSHCGIVIREKYTYYNGYNNLVINNNASYNADIGLSLVFIENTEVSNNTAIHNGVYPSVGYGISVQASRNITISFNQVQSNGKGINLFNIQECKILNNTAISNEDSGIYIERCTNSIVLENNLSHNQRGIMLRSASSDYDLSYNNSVSRNIAKNNYWGIYLFYTYNNTILENIAKDNFYGIYLRRCNQNNVSGNILIGNNHCIIEIECENNILENNYCDIPPKISGYNLIFIIGAIAISLIILFRKKRSREYRRDSDKV
ncbi:MAG: right-handed parallel beta-helix repeat-containing protein [Candidatus Hermodarchaeota archaeon]